MFGFLKSQKQDWSAKVLPAGETIQVTAGDNLLKSALAAGLNWPHDCRVGSCGTCRCILKEGKVKELSDFAYVLSLEELNAGMILGCQAALRSDVVVEVALEEEVKKVEIYSHEGAIDRVQPLTQDIVALVIKTQDNLPRTALAGQYAEIQTSSIEKPRSYSFAKAPEDEAEGEVTFFVRLVPGGEFTEWLFAQDRIGEPMTVTGPYGSFWLRPGESPIVCIAGGSGMAPIKALLENACNVGVKRDVLYLFGARTQQDLYCMDVMEEIGRKWKGKFEFVPVLSNEPDDSGWTGARGLVCDHLGKAYIESGKIDIKECQGYLCGPPPMIDAGVEWMVSAGLSKDSIYFDSFLDASSIPGGRK